MQCKWTIFRPCNVWGPWHMRYPNQLWKMIDRGIYVHPGKQPVIRTYAYVKNLVKQLDAIMNAPEVLTNHKTYYLGDMPSEAYEWINTFSKMLSGKKVNRVPKFFLACGALLGDVLGLFGIQFPLYSVRYRNMIEDYYAPSNVTVSIFGGFSQNLDDNIRETINWLEGEGAELFDYWKKRKIAKKIKI